MKYKKALIIILSVLFFLTALTVYLNRVTFPQLIKKITIERLEETLKRKVEIGSIHFSWVRGIIIDKIKIYEKSPSDAVLAQAEQVSFGIIFWPGFKHYRITIPYINVRSPSIHLIRTSINSWNFSDLFVTSNTTQPTTTATKSEKPSDFEIAWGGITINDGKFLIDDESGQHPWNEYFDNINLKLSLSYKGISYDFTANIPRKKGFVGATVYYQPITKNTQAQIHLKNIDTASYLSLINIPDVRISSGIIEEINLNINYTQDKTSADGDVLMKNLDITNHDQSFKGDIELRHLDAQYQHGDISARGQMSLNNVQTMVPGLSTGGSVQIKVNDFGLTKQGVAFNGSLHAQDIFVNLEGRQIKVQEANLDDIKISKDPSGIESVGNIITKGLFVKWPHQKLQGDIALKSVSMHIKNENDIKLTASLQADNFSTSIDDKAFSSQHILLEDAQMNIMDQKNISLNTKLSIEDMRLTLGENLLISGSLQTDKLFFNLEENIMRISSSLNFSKSKLILNHDKSIEASPQLELNMEIPLDAPQKLTYKGSVTLSDGSIQGIGPIQTLNNIELDADFQNDATTINALSVNIMDTNVRVNGTVNNFRHPVLDILAEADELDLSKIQNLIPQIVNQYGLNFKGTSFVKVKFKGLASNPLDGNILAVATFKNASVSSSKLHQEIKNITGIIEATPNSLKWRDTTANFQGKKYNLSGAIHNFKNPNIRLNIDGPGLHLDADLVKNNNLITLRSLSGKYSKANFDSNGTISLEPQGPVFDINSHVSLTLEDLILSLPSAMQKSLLPLRPTGLINIATAIKGNSLNWKDFTLNTTITCPTLATLNYKLNDINIIINEDEGQIKNATLDGEFYDGKVHAVGSMNLSDQRMPYDLAFNIDGTDLHQLKMDSPLKMDEIDGKFYFTSLAHGTIADFKNKLHATGSMAIRDGFLGEFNLFKGLLDVLNDAMNLGKITFTDAEANFTIDDQKINTDNLRLKGPTIVLLGKGWVDFDQMCDLNMTVDLSSGVVPAMAHDVLQSLNIRIYDKISNPKFKKKISVPQVINTLFKNLLQ